MTAATGDGRVDLLFTGSDVGCYDQGMLCGGRNPDTPMETLSFYCCYDNNTSGTGLVAIRCVTVT